MAEPTDKPPLRQVFDINMPGQRTVDATSRPVIVGNRPTVQDQTVTAVSQPPMPPPTPPLQNLSTDPTASTGIGHMSLPRSSRIRQVLKWAGLLLVILGLAILTVNFLIDAEVYPSDVTPLTDVIK